MIQMYEDIILCVTNIGRHVCDPNVFDHFCDKNV